MPKTLVFIGLLFLITGLALHFAPGLLKWFGNLSCDTHIEQGNSRIFIPITSMILVSIILTLITNLWR